MKFESLLTTIILLFLGCEVSFSQIDEKDKDSPITITETTSIDKNHRPKSPSRQNISCYYQSGELFFSFSVDEGICDVTVTDLTTGMPQFFEIDSAEDSYIYVGDLETASVVIRTETGHTYSGEF